MVLEQPYERNPPEGHPSQRVGLPLWCTLRHNHHSNPQNSHQPHCSRFYQGTAALQVFQTEYNQVIDVSRCPVPYIRSAALPAVHGLTECSALKTALLCQSMSEAGLRVNF